MPRAGERWTADELANRFHEIEPPLGLNEALFEAARCLNCFDAPCTRACPTTIDVPRFIRQILHRNNEGAARTILTANIYGGSCARACPTEVLCEGACVDQLIASNPIPIGRLQRFACDSAEVGFEAGPSTGKRVAILGSGPSGLSCAHALRRLGHDVVVFESRDVPGGLGTLGIAAYKVSTEFALDEVAMIRAIGIDVRLGHPIDAEGLRGLWQEYDAVFLGLGLGRTLRLGVDGEDLGGVVDALDFIFQTHQKSFEDCEVGREVVVIGAGNTAIDAATAAVRLGAERVTIAYRREQASIPAFAYEYELAKADGIHFEWSAIPRRIYGHQGVVTALECTRGESSFVLKADMVIKAIGQKRSLDLLQAFPDLIQDRGKVAVDPQTGATSVTGLYAGGDWVSRGGEIVDAVRDGKLAAAAIDRHVKSKETSHA